MIMTKLLQTARGSFAQVCSRPENKDTHSQAPSIPAGPAAIPWPRSFSMRGEWGWGNEAGS